MNSASLNPTFRKPARPFKNDAIAKLFFVLGILHLYSAVRSRVIRKTTLLKIMIQRNLKVGLLAFSVAGVMELVLS